VAFTQSGQLVISQHVVPGFVEKHGIEGGRGKTERLGPGGQEAEMPAALAVLGIPRATGVGADADGYAGLPREACCLLAPTASRIQG
jgi:hypothetical protein